MMSGQYGIRRCGSCVAACTTCQIGSHVRLERQAILRQTRSGLADMRRIVITGLHPKVYSLSYRAVACEVVGWPTSADDGSRADS